MNTTHRSIRPAAASALLVGLLTLSGCVTVAHAPDADSLAKGEGIVVLSITGNTARVGQFERLQLKRVSKGEESVVDTGVVMPQVAKGLARDTNVFLGAMPPGEYELECLTVENTSLAFNDGMRRRLGNVVVQPGKVHDLGRLVITALNTKVLVGKSALVTSNADLVRRFSPANAKLFDGPVEPGWTTPRSPDDRIEEYALGRPVGADGLVEVGNGVVAAGSRLGSILLRTSRGQWSAVRTGGLESLLSVTPLPRSMGVLAAVGEFDTIAILDAGGKVRRVGPGNLPPGNLLFVDGDPTTGWVVAHQAGTAITLYRSAKLEDGDWQPLRATTLGSSIWSGKEDQVWTWRTAGGFAYALSDGTLSFYDRAAGTFTDRHAPNGAGLVAAGPSGPGIIGAVTSGFLRSTWLSRDEGVTWQELNTPITGKVAPPRVTPGGQLLVQAGTFVDGDLRRSGDGGASWDKVMEHIDIKASVAVLPTAGVFVVEAGNSTGLASIQHSGDDGKTWRIELTNFDRDAYDAQQKRK